jgi:hypothetical protein
VGLQENKDVVRALFAPPGGRVVEEWSESDLLGLLQQLGAIPSGGS